jgi:hypothetical protein
MSPTRPRRDRATEAGPPASRRTAAGRRRTPPRRPATPAERLAETLTINERALHEAVQRFTERVAGQLERVFAIVTAPEAPKRALVAAMAARLEEIKVKPERGRLKDLARLQELAEDLVDLLPDE